MRVSALVCVSLGLFVTGAASQCDFSQLSQEYEVTECRDSDIVEHAKARTALIVRVVTSAREIDRSSRLQRPARRQFCATN